jgi:hypothetical protein
MTISNYKTELLQKLLKQGTIEAPFSKTLSLDAFSVFHHRQLHSLFLQVIVIFKEA